MLQVKANSQPNSQERNNSHADDVAANVDENCAKQDAPKTDDTAKNAKTATKRKTCKSNYNKQSCSDLNDGNDSVQSSWEKTPMCLVNDLARFNKISFQYRLTGESGPAHCKQFTVTLELGDEEYTAEGFKIKKAQHLAAKEAIQRTKYKHPVPKPSRRNDDQATFRANVTPTVELNALAMKMGQQTYYIFDPRQMASVESNSAGIFESMHQPRYKVRQPLGSNGNMKSMIISEQPQIQRNLNFIGTFVPNLASNPAIVRVHPGSHNRTKFQHCYPVVSASQQHLNHTIFPACRISLIVGTQTFYGVGRTIQQAKHDAAAQAIVKLKEQMAREQSATAVVNLNGNDRKSPISLVFEIGIKRNMSVDFKILREDGLAHMRKFVTACIVGDIVTEGEGTGKKISKKIAAQKMIEELNKLPPISPVNSPIKRIKSKTPTKKILIPPFKHKNVPQIHKLNTEKCPKTNCDFDNPVVKMIEWCRDSNYSEPVFKTISEKSKDRSRRAQFVVEVSSNDCTAQGVGNSKKSAKRNAAQNFLISVGSKTTETLSASAVDIITTESDSKNGRQPIQNVPISSGSNITEDLSASSVGIATKESPPKIVRNSEQSDPTSNQCEPLVANNAVVPSGDLAIARDLNTKTSCSYKVKSNGFHMKDKLLYLARLIGFEVDISDYPKGNHNEFLTILMISTNPPQICHGVGVNVEQSQEDASRNALKILSEMGLNSMN